jgi:hypothetical protein
VSGRKEKQKVVEFIFSIMGPSMREISIKTERRA